MEWPNRRHVLALTAAAPLAGLAGGCMPRRVSQGPVGLDASAAFLDRLVADGRLPGGAIRISRNGDVLLEHFAGKADIGSGRDIAADTIYRAYSMTKPVTAAAIMVLVDEGKVALQDPVARHVPEFDGLSVILAVDGETRSGGVGLLRDLQDLYTLASFIDIAWTVVGQAGQGLADRDLLDVVGVCEADTAVQLRWLRTRIKQAAPQALIAAR